MAIKRVLVIGGTGMLGRPVVERLAKEGFDVTVGTRFVGTVDRIFGEKFPAVEIDLSDIVSVKKALENQDAVHLNFPSGPTFEACFRNESKGARAVSIAAADVTIKRISYLSGGTVHSKSKFHPVKAKYFAEEAIRNSGIPFTIWRATWFMESLEMLHRGDGAIMPGKGKEEYHWLAADDLGKMIAAAFRTEEAVDKVFYPFGPEKLSFREALTTYSEISHPNARIKSVPLGLMSLMGLLPGRQELRFAAQLMKHFERTGEMGDPAEAIRIVGAASTTVTEFAESIEQQTDPDKK
ncbi:MAG: NAD(P)H-binding protein [Candidatus Electryoneaceae bacterium]|nr:NAD(P)H-binding protein [Candidatus Electryoneaceae bacterium]